MIAWGFLVFINELTWNIMSNHLSHVAGKRPFGYIHSDAPAHPCSQTKTFVLRCLNSIGPIDSSYHQERLWSDCTDVQLILVLAGCTCPKVCFLRHSPFCNRHWERLEICRASPWKFEQSATETSEDSVCASLFFSMNCLYSIEGWCEQQVVYVQLCWSFHRVITQI